MRERERALKTNISVIRAPGSEINSDGNAARQARLVPVKPIRIGFALRIMYVYVCATDIIDARTRDDW